MEAVEMDVEEQEGTGEEFLGSLADWLTAEAHLAYDILQNGIINKEPFIL